MSKFKVFEMVSDKQSIDKLCKEIKALDPQPKYVLVLYSGEVDGLGSLDNGVPVHKCIYIVECFKHWLLSHFLKGT